MLVDVNELNARSDRYHERWFQAGYESRIPYKDRLPPTATVKQLEILRALTLLRFSTVEHLCKFTGRKSRRIQESLEVLRNKKLVAWFRWVDTRVMSQGMDPLTTTFVYCLTTSGVERCILDRVIQDDRYLLTRSWRGKPVLHATMPHQLGIVDICLGLSIASRQSATHEVREMVPDFVFTDIEGKSRVSTIEMLNTSNELRADLIARIWAKILGRSFVAYFELERTAKNAQKIMQKFENYSVLFKAKERRFDQGTPVLLYVVTNCVDERDTEKRMKLVRSWAANKPVAPAFRITSLKKISNNAFGQIWQKIDGSPWGIGE